MKHLALPLFVAFFALGGCATQIETDGLGGGSSSSSSAGGEGGATVSSQTSSSTSTGGMLCAQNCATVETPECQVAVCNEMTGTCELEDAPDDSPCEDGLYCTIEDTCQAGMCQPGQDRVCEGSADQCLLLACDEDADACLGGPVGNGMPCTSAELCEANAICQNGVCKGAPKDCSSTPVDDCNYAVCNPTNGLCEPTPDPSQDDFTCTDGGDPCMIGKTCDNGVCQGGVPKSCSALDVGCQNGVCNPVTGACQPEIVPVGGQCNAGADDCNIGTCNASNQCVVAPAPNGTACNDFSSCSTGDACSSGACSGTVDPNCPIYFESSFEQCPPPGWVLSGQWACGSPNNAGPPTAYQGLNAIACVLTGEYTNNLSYDTNYAQTPPIDLTGSTQPTLTYRHYVDTEGNTYDGYNVKVSTDGGMSWSVITGVTPPYNLTVNAQPAWGGHQGALGWQLVSVNLTPYVGQTIMLRFSFRTDVSITYPGIFIDNVEVREP